MTTTNEDKPMFYVIETVYAGPNEQQHLDAHTYHVQTCPGLLNMSHKPEISGWLGTTNDWAEYAYGEYDTLEGAKTEIDRLTNGDFRNDEIDRYADTVGLDREGNPTGKIVYRVKVGNLEPWTAADSEQWCYESMKEAVTWASTDAEIDEWSDECERWLAEEEQGQLDVGAVYGMAIEYRDDLRAAKEADDNEEGEPS